MRVPDVRRLEAPAARLTLAEASERWRTSRVDVSTSTAATHKVNLRRILSRLGTRPVDALTPADVAQLVAELAAEGLARKSIRKTRATLAMVLDHHGLQPNPARDKTVKLPWEDRPEVNPPTAEHLQAVFALLPPRYRLPLLALDSGGMRLGELEALRLGDVDEPGGRWRVSQAVAKTRQARWVPVNLDVFAAVSALMPREDRDVAGQVFAGFGADRFRTALTRACKAAAVPLCSPHDLRHRPATLCHLGGVPLAEAAAWLGHSPQEHLKTYAHATLIDRSELDYPKMLERVRLVRTPVRTPAAK